MAFDESGFADTTVTNKDELELRDVVLVISLSREKEQSSFEIIACEDKNRNRNARRKPQVRTHEGPRRRRAVSHRSQLEVAGSEQCMRIQSFSMRYDHGF